MKKLMLLSLLTGLGASCSQSPPESASEEMPPITGVTTPSEPIQQPSAPLPPPRIWRTWTFAEDVKVRIQSGGTMSFCEGGRLDGDFIRADGQTAVIKLIDGNNAEVPIVSLCKEDQKVLQSVAGLVINERSLDQEAGWRRASARAQRDAIAAEKANEEARELARYYEDKAKKEEQERSERLRKSSEPAPSFEPAVKGRWPVERVQR